MLQTNLASKPYTGPKPSGRGERHGLPQARKRCAKFEQGELQFGVFAFGVSGLVYGLGFSLGLGQFQLRRYDSLSGQFGLRGGQGVRLRTSSLRRTKMQTLHLKF